ncbi:MAG: UDP-N-acetylmuramoyl-L-alanyl-D-glutamate--2,6-diaminopimelate ligase [Chlamydiales bacterium]
MGINLKELVIGLPVELYRGGKNVSINGLCSNSKLVAPGNLFIAKKGMTHDGAQYIDEAIASGAIAILTDTPNPFLKEITQIITNQVGLIESEFAARYYGDPSKSLFMVGVTGTNGKTTTSYLVKYIFDALRLFCGIIGTIEYIIRDQHFTAQLTSPDIITNQKLLREMIRQKCTAAVMEVSSFGLEQGRVEKIDYDVAIFTNLSHDHLDYHKTMEAYADAKAKLFQKLKPKGIAVLNLDSPWSEKMRDATSADILTYGFNPKADLYAHSFKGMPDETHFSISFKDQTLSFVSKLIGRFNVYNCLAAIGAALCKGIAFQSLPEIIMNFPRVRGRLERVEHLNDFHIYVDYAHTPDAMEKVLLALSDLKERNILTLFGCGGNRDHLKRPQMAQVVEKYSDFAVITSDNPRNEDPLTICREIACGFTRSKDHFSIEVDRRLAIEQIIKMAKPKDLILIAGKGHETYQTFSYQTFPFDDRQVAQEIANRVKRSAQ